MSEHIYRQQFEEIIRNNEWFMSILRDVRLCNPPDWYVGAGVIRNIVWDYLHGLVEDNYNSRDVDVAFFDPSNLTPERDAEVQQQLSALRHDVPWEATNQAAVHLWYESVFGYSVPPLESTESAIRTWPETATSIGVKLLANDSLNIYVPFGLEDLMTMKLRRNRTRISLELYRKRIAEKQPAQRWPRLQIIDEYN
ncbi:nucleotidyltransferase family protein [Paenibacillus sinopodophylli]|uniref:nucleotidyltransferase family protein n=1 Tax=Paenibacillus sinopodophylli TaxID=1837342 RepID=UPI00110CF7BC|nr:nucleotidyltransferase family protein [Paenibacillus sinopodophylli]